MDDKFYNAIELATNSTKEHEGLMLMPYRDIVGVLTIGYGTNIERITEQEAELLLNHRIEEAYANCVSIFGEHFDMMNSARQAVLINMAYNLGMPRLKSFQKMRAAIRNGDYKKAADEMLDSKWARQVGVRAQELSDIFRKG